MDIMRIVVAALILIGIFSTGCVRLSDSRAEAVGLKSFLDKARNFSVRLSVPQIEQTPEALQANVTAIFQEADEKLSRLASQDPRGVTFASSIAALDDITYPVATTRNRMGLMKDTQVEESMRHGATEQVRRMNEWYVGLVYRTDIYEMCQAFESAHQTKKRPRLQGEDLRLLEETMRDYRRAGLHLDAETRRKVETLKKKLALLVTDFGRNITDAEVTLTYTRQELDGFTEEMLARYANDKGGYRLKATVTPEFLAVMNNARSEESRKRMKLARYTTAKKENLPLLNRIVKLRDRIKDLLGYETWADYQVEVRMAKTGETALAYVTDLAERLEPKFLDELETLRKLKAKQTGQADAEIHIWDWRYYQNEMLKERFKIDHEALRVYFPYEACLEGMFEVYEEIFGLTITQVIPEQAWHPDVTLHVVSDAKTGEPLGVLYLDMFPRSGKYNHFAQFGIIDGKLLADGTYQRPCVALVCNFTPPVGDKPSLLSHGELRTLFHEFGHAMHSLLTRAKYNAFSGTDVPRDFVEAPSQMLEAWIWDSQVLNRFAGDYRDPKKKLDPQFLARMKEAKLATTGMRYRRQLSLAIGDLRLHGTTKDKDAQHTVNQSLGEWFLAPPEGTAFAAYWGHMGHYDAGYYGYAWARGIASDMEQVFQEGPGGLMSSETGMRLRKEIYEPGHSRDVEESIEAFLGRKRSLKPFLKSLGLETDEPCTDC